MTVSELHEIIGRGEDSRTQFKREFRSIDALATEISAMLNSDGGQIIVGVSDSGEVTGIENVRKLNQWISNACSQKNEPPASVRTENLTVDDACAPCHGRRRRPPAPAAPAAARRRRSADRRP